MVLHRTLEKWDVISGGETLAKRGLLKSSRMIGGEIENAVSSRTVRRRLVSAKLPGRMARKIPLLTIANLKKRKNLAE